MGNTTFTDLVAANPSAPSFSYRFQEPSGTTIADSGTPANLPLTTNGTISLGQTGIVPGDTNTCVFQDKVTHVASRADNGLWDRPSTSKLSLMACVKPYKIRVSAAPIISKASVYQLILADTGSNTGQIRADIMGQTNLISGADLIAPGQLSVIFMTFDPVGQTWKIYLNGVVVASVALAAAQTIPWANGNPLNIGSSAFDNDGFSGWIQHVNIWEDIVLSATNVQNITAAAFGTGISGQAKVYPWDTTILAANGAAAYRRITNDSDSAWWLNFNATASVGAGYKLPAGETWPDPNAIATVDTRAVHAIHGSYFGVKNGTVFER